MAEYTGYRVDVGTCRDVVGVTYGGPSAKWKAQGPRHARMLSFLLYLTIDLSNNSFISGSLNAITPQSLHTGAVHANERV